MLTSEEVATSDMRFIKSNRMDRKPIFNFLARLDVRLINGAELSSSLLAILPIHAGISGPFGMRIVELCSLPIDE